MTTTPTLKFKRTGASKTIMLKLTRERNFYRASAFGLLAALALSIFGGLYMVGVANEATTTALAKIETYKTNEATYEDYLARANSDRDLALAALTTARKEIGSLRTQVTEKADEIARLSTNLATRETELAEKSKSFFDFATKTEPKPAPTTTETATTEDTESWLDKTTRRIGNNIDGAYNSVVGFFDKK